MPPSDKWHIVFGPNVNTKAQDALLPDGSPSEPPYPAGARRAVVVQKRGSVVINITAKEAASKREVKHFPLT